MATKDLLKIAGPSLFSADLGATEAFGCIAKFGNIGTELSTLLDERNGFFAFESALLVRGIGQSVAPRDLMSWNCMDLWIHKYAAFGLPEFLFFAEDAFGNQFAIGEERIFSFDPETGEASPMANSLEEWSRILLADWNYHTGYPVAHEWQKANGPLKPGTRLVPKLPFVAGGAFIADNIHALPEVTAMAHRSELANQIRNLPDGAKIRIEVDDQKH